MRRDLKIFALTGLITLLFGSWLGGGIFGSTVVMAASQLQVAKEIVAKPGETVTIPVRARSNQPIASTSHIIIDGAPAWLKLSSGEAVGGGVWLLRASELANLKGEFPDGAKGTHDMSVLLVDKDGKIISESRMALKVQTKTPVQQGARTWQSLLKGGTVAPGAPKAKPARQAKKIKVAARIPKTTVKKKMNAKQQRSYAKHLVRECTTCHSLFGQDVGIPVMVGLTVDRFLDTMQLYRDGKRDNIAMINVARSLDEQQLNVLAEYLGSVRPAARVKRARRAKKNNTARASAASSTAGATQQAQSALILAKRKITPVKLKRADGWVVKGRALLEAGRVAQARLWFKRAAEYGVAQAAMLLGSSFDPNFLTSGSGGGLIPDHRKAKDWYMYARQLGSQLAAQRLANLPAG